METISIYAGRWGERERYMLVWVWELASKDLIEVGRLGPDHRFLFKLEDLIKMENELDQDLLTVKSHGYIQGRKGDVWRGGPL